MLPIPVAEKTFANPLGEICAMRKGVLGWTPHHDKKDDLDFHNPIHKKNLLMGLFSVFKKNSSGQFVSVKQFTNKADKQVDLFPQALNQLRELGVTPDKELKLEFFFYSNTIQKVEKLSDELKKMHYKVQFGQSQGDKKLFISTGWTAKMRMDNGTVISWTKEMCELGYKFDCDFDGWGTAPEQE